MPGVLGDKGCRSSVSRAQLLQLAIERLAIKCRTDIYKIYKYFLAVLQLKMVITNHCGVLIHTITPSPPFPHK
jgi:hypothetical protein